jgi:iron(III) transport system substrate-binding protein
MVVLPQTHRLILLLAALLLACKPSGPTVVVYASQDQVYAEPILKQFEKETGIRVRAIYDSEAVKTVGLVNRLLAEKNNPQCDVFWNNEELRTRQLAAKQIVNAWAAVGHRSRRIVIAPNLLKVPASSLIELTNSQWKRKVVLAYPLFGSTATHFLALRQLWGAEKWEQWCRALRANDPFLVDGNSVVVQFVGRGEALIGLTDSDDISAGQGQGMPITALPVSPETLFIPNTIAIVSNAPHPAEAKRLFDYLRRPDVLNALVKANALEGTEPRQNFPIAWEGLLAELEPATTKLKEIFLR